MAIVKFDPNRHCGAVDFVGNVKKVCMALKGQGTSHLGKSYCSAHEGNANYYTHIDRNRVSSIIQAARQMGVDPSDITSELELVRGLLIVYLEEHTDLSDSTSLSTTGEMIDRVARLAAQYRKMRQEEMIHKMALVLLEQEMANLMMREIELIEPNLVAEWKTVLIERIREGWGNISVPTSVRELKRITENGGGLEEVASYGEED